MEKGSPSLERYADLLDTKYRIPGTDIRFGYDFVIGLVPGMGDVISFSLSCGLLGLMIIKGASGRALALMILNILLDTIIGSIPFIGDVFDIYFKANKRNLDLFQDHFQSDMHQGSAWSVVIPILLMLIALFVFLLWGIYLLFSWFLHLIY